MAGYVKGASAEGANTVVDGSHNPTNSNGFFLAPSLLDNVKPGMRCYDDEIFGPVLNVVRVKT